MPAVPGARGVPGSAWLRLVCRVCFVRLLCQLDIEEHAAVLADESIRSDADLRALTQDDLRELGFKMGARKRVLSWSGQ